MTEEQTRRLVGAQKSQVVSAKPTDPPVLRQELRGISEHFSAVPDRPSARPDAFSEREGPTLASPSSAALSTDFSLEQKVLLAIDRIHQLEADLEALFTRVAQLTEDLNAERLRGRAARMGRYLLWGAVIAAMATFWMLLRLRAGLR